jgi:hypothetical protein
MLVRVQIRGTELDGDGLLLGLWAGLSLGLRCVRHGHRALGIRGGFTDERVTDLVVAGLAGALLAP